MEHRVIVVGGQSSLGLALRRCLPKATFVVRRVSQPGDLVVNDYRELDQAGLVGFDSLVNCTGVSMGDPELLMRANVELPSLLAGKARNANIGRFVHVSSFSVYGSAKHITAATLTLPASAYGRAKLAGDEALLAMATEDFQPAIVRLPAIIDGQRSAGKVARLMAAWARLGFFPIPATDVRRSMISASLAARVLSQVAMKPSASVIMAADEQPFAYRTLAQALADQLGRKFDTIPIPTFLLAMLKLVARDASQSLFEDSFLEHSSNFAAGMPSDLYATLVNLTKTVVQV